MSLSFLLYKLVHQSSLNFLILFSFLLRFFNSFFFLHWLKALRWRGVRHTGLDFGETQAGFVIGTLVLGLFIFLAVILGWERVSVFYFIFLLLILWFFSLCIVILGWETEWSRESREEKEEETDKKRKERNRFFYCRKSHFVCVSQRVPFV